MREVKIRATRLVVTTGEIWADGCTTIEISNEGGGDFITMHQMDAVDGVMAFDVHEWPVIRNAVESLIKDIEENKHDQ